MHTISITYTLIFQVSFATEYKFSKCKRNKEIHQTMNGGSIGYCIRGKFYSLTFLRKYLEKIPIKQKLPF